MPGQIYKCAIELSPMANVFKVDHRIKLELPAWTILKHQLHLVPLVRFTFPIIAAVARRRFIGFIMMGSTRRTYSYPYYDFDSLEVIPANKG